MACRRFRQDFPAQNVHNRIKSVHVFFNRFMDIFLLAHGKPASLPELPMRKHKVFIPIAQEIRNPDIQSTGKSLDDVHARSSVATLVMADSHWGHFH